MKKEKIPGGLHLVGGVGGCGNFALSLRGRSYTSSYLWWEVMMEVPLRQVGGRQCQGGLVRVKVAGVGCSRKGKK